MKKNVILLTLVTLCLFLIASCTNCNADSSQVAHTCDGGGSCTNPAVSSAPLTEASASTHTSGIPVLVDEANEVNVCQDNTPNSCLHPHDESIIKVDLIKKDTWELTLPLGFKEKTKSKPGVDLITYSERDQALVVVTKEKFAGKFEEYVIVALRNAKDTGAKVESTKTVDSEGKKFILLEMTKNDIKVWSLVTTKDGFGYGVSCGGPPPHEPINSLCSVITNSFNLI